jgi:peptide/nickel transport system permease protein
MSAVLPSAAVPVPSPMPSGPWRRAWKRLARRKAALLGLAIVIAFIVLAIAAPWIAPYDPIATSWSAVRKAPSAQYWFGTDEIGRDVLSRVIWGTRASLLAGIVSVTISLLVGVPIGLAAGFLGGWVDAIISRITDAFLACPFLILAIALAAFLGPSLSNAMVAIGISAAPIFVRLTRGQVLGVKVEDYIEAARAVGNPPLRIALRPILPNIAKNFVDNAPWMAIWPGVSIFLLVLSFNLLGDGLRDALDPRQ